MFTASEIMQVFGGWLGFHDGKSRQAASGNDAGLLGHDREPTLYPDLCAIRRPAVDISFVTSTISIIALSVPPQAMLAATTDVSTMFSTIAKAMAATPNARDHHNWEGLDGKDVSVTGTAKAMLDGMESYVNTVLLWLIKGELESPEHVESFRTASTRAYADALLRSQADALLSPLASAKIIADVYVTLCCAMHRILRVTPVSLAPTVAAVIMSSLADVANTLAATPEEQMHTVAASYASWASPFAQSVASGIHATTSLQDAISLAVRQTTDRLSGYSLSEVAHRVRGS
jgi:hypothetical protein